MPQDYRRGQRIRIAIHERNWPKAHALAAALKVSPAAVSRWQNGGHISLENACLLAETLDISLDWLLVGRGEMDIRETLTHCDCDKKIHDTHHQYPAELGDLLDNMIQLITAHLEK